MRVLVADDYADTREIMRLLLEMKGHEVIEARDGEEAVRRAVETRPDLILMDINMPGVDGLTATRQLRAHPVTADLPIVAVTAQGLTERWRERAIDCGFDECFGKPLDFEAVEALLQVPADSPRSPGSGPAGGYAPAA